MKAVLLFSVLIASTFAEFKYRSCGGDDSYVTIRKLEVTPDPLSFPGAVNFNVDADLKKAVKDVSMTVKIVRNTFLLDVTLPCVKQIGSCSYRKMCSFVDDMYNEDWGTIGKKIAGQIGDYTVQVEFKDNSANKIIQCVEVEAELKKKSDGSFWGKRRLRN